MAYRPSLRQSRVTSSAQWCSRPTRHCDDADFTDGLATRTLTITHHPVYGATKTTQNATKNVTGRKRGPVLLVSFFAQFEKYIRDVSC